MKKLYVATGMTSLTMKTVRTQGKYECHCVHHDEAFNHNAAEWVRQHAFVKQT